MMNDETVDITEEIKPQIGKRLTAAREEKGWTVSEVADKLHYHARWVEHLENDEYHDFSAIAYAKGYLRSYAKLLGLPADEIIRDLTAYNLDSHIEVRKPQLIITRQASTRDRSVRWITYGIGGLLLTLVVLWWHSMHTPTESVSSKTIIETKVTKNENIEGF